MSTATYSPEDNKLRLYPSQRLDVEIYQRMKASGFSWAPKQGLFVAPMWTPSREDLLLELCGEIGDEDTSLVERAEERADRFQDYGAARLADAECAQERVSAIADNIPFGQPILVGHHSEKRARRDAKKIENGMRQAVRMWEQSRYWTDRAKGAIRAAKYKERPDVRARRIKSLETDLRKQERNLSTSEKFIAAWSAPGLTEKTAKSIANYDYCGRCFPLSEFPRVPPASQYEGAMGLWSAMDGGIITFEQAREIAMPAHKRTIAHCARWIAHIENRLAYERAMLEEAGGTVADQVRPERGGACQCWASPHGGWSLIQKVNKVSVTLLDNWGNGGRDFTRTIPFDKLTRIISAEDVKRARVEGRLIAETPIGFILAAGPPAPAVPKSEAEPNGAKFQALKETLEAGVQVVMAPQLFPTPPEIAAEMVGRLFVGPGMRLLEPSAGTGNLIRALPNIRGPYGGEVVAVEVNLKLTQSLEPWADRVICSDFLACTTDGLGSFDRIIMNPPFENGADIKHIQHALQFLKPGGILVALCANGPRQQESLCELGEWHTLPAGSFKEQGTGVNVAMLIIETEPETINPVTRQKSLPF